MDPKTGLYYRTLPKTEWTEGGHSRSTILDEEMPNPFSDLNTAAGLFLPHLRVTPSKKEIQELREAKAKQVRAQNKRYAEVVRAAEEEERED